MAAQSKSSARHCASRWLFWRTRSSSSVSTLPLLTESAEPPWYVIRMPGGVGGEGLRGPSLSRLGEVDTMEATILVEEIIEAHGGAALWSSLGVLEAEISAWGFLFTAKRRPTLKRVVVSASTREPRLAFHDFPGSGLTGELIGDQEVRIVGSDGKSTATRLNPRSAFTGLRRMETQGY